jgi:hypothetical protein
VTASLIVAGYDVLGTTTNPEYRLAPDFDFGQGEPDQATITSLYLDGETLSGLRTTNRTIKLPILVRGTTPLSLSAFVTTLLFAVSQPTFSMTWTPDGGLPVNFDCYRAQWQRTRSLVADAQGETQLVLTFQARPFGRSSTAQTVSAGSTLQVDSFDTLATGATLNTTTKYEGTGSAQFASWTFGGTISSSSTISRSFASKDLSAFTSVGLRLFTPVSSPYVFNVFLTLTSASGTTSYTGSLVLPVSRWSVLYLPFSGGTITSGTGVTLSAVTSFTIQMTGRANMVGQQMLVDDMRAVGSGTTVIGPTSHASVLSVPVSIGSARTPVSIALSNASTFAAFLLHSPPEDQDSNAAILSSLSNASNSQTVTIAAVNGNLRGTYTVVLGVDIVGGGAVTATVTITQQQSAVNVGTAKVLSKAYTSGAHVIPVGEVTLPLYDVPVDNNTTGYTVQVVITGADRYTEVMLLDTRGQTILSDTDLTTAVANVYIDEPSALQSAPAAYGGASRAVATSVLASSILTGGPIVVEPGVNAMLAWVSTSTPVLTATFYPRWLDERVT